MTRPKLVVIHPEQPDQSRSSRDGKRYRFELSKKKLVFYISSFAFALCWMFILGVLVGRGIALVGSEDFSARADFMRFLGLGKQAGQPVPKAAETWGDPRKMLESLNYYEDLTQRGVGITVASVPKPVAEDSASAITPPVEPEPVKETAHKRPPAPVQPQAPPEKAAAPVPERVARSTAAQPAAISGEQFTLLVASLKDPENAQRLIDQLARKGYSPRLEPLDLNGGGRWNRVLVGSFSSREAALKFAAEFNRKEHMEGLVIRESN
ncbi:MAG: SPOR domain-containing protein [Syntrophobacteraceae bacterium]